MRFNYSHVLAGAALVLLGAGNLLAAEEPLYQVSESPEEFAARFGWWGVATTGSQVKTGEYQGLSSSSPFWDIDRLRSDGHRTLDFFANGPEDESTQAGLHYYRGPGLTVDLGYERFLHRLEKKTYPGWADDPSSTPAGGNVPYSRNDFNAGEDYAIRVQEFKANFKGNITDNIKWRLNTFGIYKQGDRQANAMAHCYNAAPPSPDARIGTVPSSDTTRRRQCHVVSQSQHIDWQTTEVEPVIEVALTDGLRLEYSHTARVFEQRDQMVNNYYRNELYGDTLGWPDPTSPGGAAVSDSVAGYAIVPNSTTQIDRLKAHVQLGEDTNAYVLSYVGDTKNELRETNRHFGGVDARITNQSIDGLTLTGYGKAYTENTQKPTQSLNSLYPNLDLFYRESTPPNTGSTQNPTGFSYLDEIHEPINRDTNAFGATARWRPFVRDSGTLRSRLALTGGYEYSQIRRTFAEDEILKTSQLFIQPDTDRNTFMVGIEERWSLAFSSYIRYKRIETDYPLYGITPGVNSATAVALDDALNSNLPTEENRVEIGGTWSPTDVFMLNATFYIENALNHGPYVNFDSTGYPFILSAWYAPGERWSLTGGYASFTNWIDQDITLTSSRPEGTGGGNSPPALTTSPWGYTAKADVFNIGTTYAWTERLALNGGFEYVRGLNSITQSAPPGQAYQLGDYSLVSVNTYRFWAGIDYLVRHNINTYFRYNYYDYGDDAVALNSGTAHMFLGGMTAMY